MSQEEAAESSSEKRLAVHIPVEFAMQAHCAVGATLQVPIALSARGIESCTISAQAEGDVIEATNQTVELDPRRTTRAQRVLEIRAIRQTDRPAWVTIRLLGDREVPQQSGFFVEIGPS